MPLPPNTNKVGPGHICDVCREKEAIYYNLTWYIHICSLECLEIFFQRYNIEIDNFSIVKIEPDSQGDDKNAV